MNLDDALRLSIVPALSILPPQMDSPEARAMLLAIGLQESRFLHRRQLSQGPARGWWQFETNGVKGVREHFATRDEAARVLERLEYSTKLTHSEIRLILQHNDILAAAFARLNLWWIPGALPSVGDTAESWNQYIFAWRPGKPHAQTWSGHFERAWNEMRRSSA